MNQQVFYHKDMHQITYVLLILIPAVFQTGTSLQDDDIPQINREIIRLTDSLMGKTIGRGECWDLAYYVLEHTNADWNKKLEYGRQYKPSQAQILPGDIIQFQNTVFIRKEGNKTIKWKAPKHTAIVMEVNDSGKLTIAHQNADGKRYVTRGTINPGNLARGKLLFYRPKKL